MTTLIVGGGLSGLALAEALQTRGLDYLLVEARDRFGGRILSEPYGAGHFDMGPAWFWPAQPRIVALLERLNLTKFDQFSDGALTFEDEQGSVQRGTGFASMEGSWRVSGGLATLTNALAARIPQDRIWLGAVVTHLAQRSDGIRATVSDGQSIDVQRVVLALPPRIAAQIDYTPALPEPTLHSMRQIATWMAGQAKAVAIYDTPFWRDQGLSGDAMSRKGPMVEIHDASPEKGGPYALFGFIGVPPDARRDETLLRQSLVSQLERLFGSQAANPEELFLKDWAFDPFTSTQDDHAPLYAHPTYGLPDAMRGLWGGQLHFAGTEVAPQFGGYLEGALEAAAAALVALMGAE